MFDEFPDRTCFCRIPLLHVIRDTICLLKRLKHIQECKWLGWPPMAVLLLLCSKLAWPCLRSWWVREYMVRYLVSGFYSVISLMGCLIEQLFSCTYIICGHAQNGQPLAALTVYCQMRKTNMEPHWIALVIWSFWNKEKLFMVSWLSWALNLNLICLFHLQPCKQNLGKWWLRDHCLIRCRYQPNVTLWNAMISGYAKNGYAEEAVKLFREMISK